MNQFDEDYYCPNCGATLNAQEGFDPDDGYWTCTECGKTLYGDGIYEGSTYKGVMWTCDNCGALLNSQSGFTDTFSTWTCTECGHINNISESEIFESEEEWQNSMDTNGYDDSDECDGDDEESSSECLLVDFTEEAIEAVLAHRESIKVQKEANAVEQERNDIERERNIIAKERIAIVKKAGDERRKSAEKDVKSTQKIEVLKNRTIEEVKRDLIIKRTLIIIMVCLVLVGCAIFGIYQYKQYREVGISSNECKSLPVDEVVALLEKSGFDNIATPVASSDLAYEDLQQEGTVRKVAFGEEIRFHADTKYRHNETVTIYYHSAKKVVPPITSDTDKRWTYNEAKKKFEDAGFGNIEVKASYDTILPIGVQVGNVKYISIDKDKKYESNSKYRVDSKITIVYHDYFKNRF